MRLKPDAAHRAGQPSFGEIAGRALQRLEQRAAGDDRADRGELDPLALRAERLLDQRGGIGRVLGEDRQRLGRKSRLLQRVEPLGRPRDVLKHSDRE